MVKNGNIRQTIHDHIQTNTKANMKHVTITRYKRRALVASKNRALTTLLGDLGGAYNPKLGGCIVQPSKLHSITEQLKKDGYTINNEFNTALDTAYEQNEDDDNTILSTTLGLRNKHMKLVAFKNHFLVHIRQCHAIKGSNLPLWTKKGICLNISEFNDLKDNIEMFDAEIKSRMQC